MREFIINKNDAGQRLDKFLTKAVKTLPHGLLYKGIRLKRIKVNNKRCQPNQILVPGDRISLYLNDEFFFAYTAIVFESWVVFGTQKGQLWYGIFIRYIKLPETGEREDIYPIIETFLPSSVLRYSTLAASEKLMSVAEDFSSHDTAKGSKSKRTNVREIILFIFPPYSDIPSLRAILTVHTIVGSTLIANIIAIIAHSNG